MNTYTVDLARKERAQRIIIRHYLGRKPLADCWFEFVAGATCTPEAATRKAQEDISWHRRAFPDNLHTTLFRDGLDGYEIVKGLREKLDATDDSGIPDSMTQLEALRVWANIYAL